ncbi:F-box/LRR-repeat protein [Raphanus sativus]|uniref:Uncharacterized protein LOC108815315 n=1 Tax=Raphanus sativus TaxID=3726 RepID=A0A6J0K916_RAPSA|nr:uncharacterized protein LOC108815315 [Raphanus sativus]KAJ4866636.1 F-box/LRR-repeat protein [Raphanus sativus]
MEKQEFLELFEAAILAAKSAARGDGMSSSPAVSRCVDAMVRLREAPQSLACELVKYPQIGKSHVLLMDHNNPTIQSEATFLYSLWTGYLYVRGRKQNPRSDKGKQSQRRDGVHKKKLVEEMKILTTGDSNRDRVRGILHKSLSRVANEVVVVEMKKQVVSCDSWSVAASVESAMFEKLGSFEGTQKAKYRSILFNMRDSSNPDLRRKVLLGEISGERLVTMKKEEMASNKIQMEVQKIKEKARDKEENRVKSMMVFQSGSMILTLKF